MSHNVALGLAWENLEKIAESLTYNVYLMGDTYEVKVKDKRVFSNSCNIPAQDYVSILVLHYLIGSLENKYAPCGQWISFKEIEGGETYYPAFYKAIIEPLLRKYGKHPEAIFSVLDRFQGNKTGASDAAVELVTFTDIRVRIVLWKADEEFGPEASILFDRNLPKLFTMEDITIFCHFIVSNL